MVEIVKRFLIGCVAAAFLFGCSPTFVHLPKTCTYAVVDKQVHIEFHEVTLYEHQDLMNLKFYMKAKGLKELHLHMMNPGGYVLPMMAVLDMLEQIKADGIKLVTYAHGMVGSAAVPIYLLGDTRIFDKHAQLMLHAMSGTDGYINEDTKNMFMQWEARYQQIVADVTTLDLETITKMLSGNSRWDLTWLNSQEALKYGFATELR